LLLNALAPGQDIWNALFNLGCCEHRGLPRASMLCVADYGILINPALVPIVEKHHLNSCTNDLEDAKAPSFGGLGC
jgi:hypothetical protein